MLVSLKVSNIRKARLKIKQNKKLIEKLEKEIDEQLKILSNIVEDNTSIT